MKYCEEYAALLDLFVDGELPPEDMERVRAHLETCPGCRGYVDDALAIRAGFPDAEDTIVPEGFAEGVMERVRKGKTVELRRRSLRRQAGTLAALAACCALVILTRTGGGDGAAADTTAVPGGAPEVYSQAETGEDGAGARTPPESPETEAAGVERRAEKIPDGDSTGGYDCDEEVPPLAAPAEFSAEMAEMKEDAAQSERAALCLSAGEAGEFLKDYAPVWEDSVSSRYELSAEEYRALLAALGRPEEETGEGTFVVVVNWALE